MDRERFAKVMALLGEVFRTDLTPLMIKTYYEILSDVSIELIEENAYKHMRNAIFFPKPIELRSESGVMRPYYHQIYTPPWRMENRWKALPEGRKEIGDGDAKHSDLEHDPERGDGTGD